jgi:glycosyltransferase involved in cell wall biosynthesis
VIKVSVVIPLYNKKKYIRRCLKSCLNQIIAPHEVIIVDDGSTDGSESAIADLVSGFEHVVLHKQGNLGVSMARNVGVRVSTGDFIVFLDADDEWEIDHILILVELYNRFPSVNIWASNYQLASCPIEKIELKSDFIFISYMEYLDSCAHASKHLIWTSCVMVRRDQFIKIGGFSIYDSHGEDLQLWLRLVRPHGFGWASRVTSTYHKVENSLSSKTPLIDDACMRELSSLLGKPDVRCRNERALLRAYFCRLSVSHMISAVINDERSLFFYFNGQTSLFGTNCFKRKVKVFGLFVCSMFLPRRILLGLLKSFKG